MKVSRFGYFWLDTWVMANIIQLATQDFCSRFLNHSNDPGGRLYDQMTQAARSAPANIAEGNSRHTTSKETEMRLTDVARATLAELNNDYFNWLLRHEQLPWSVNSPEYKQVASVLLDKPTYDDDLQYQSGIHILRQKKRFDIWLDSNDSFQIARCLIVLCNRLATMLSKQIEQQLTSYSQEGGFTEALTVERLSQRTQLSINTNAPQCPVCGKPMIRRVAKKGVNSGNEFWSCSGYPECNGTRSIKWKGV